MGILMRRTWRKIHLAITPGRTKPHPRDENLRDIRNTSRRRWKERVKYHIRSLVESAIFCFKSIFGDKLHARKLGQQKIEVGIKVAILQSDDETWNASKLCCRINYLIRENSVFL